MHLSVNFSANTQKLMCCSDPNAPTIGNETIRETGKSKNWKFLLSSWQN